MRRRKATIGMAIVGLALLLLVGCTGGGGTSKYAVSGTVTDVDGNGIKGVSLSFEGFGTADSDENGKWRKDGLSGTVRVAPTKDGWVFEPSSRTVSKADSSVNFVATMLEYPLTIQVQGEGYVNQEVLVAAQGNEYEHGTQIQLTAVPAAGWLFSHWEGDLDSNENPATIVVDSEKSVTAVFIEAEYTLTINEVGLGTVSITPNQPTYNYGDLVVLEAFPSTGWAFSEWTGEDLSGHSNPVSITVNDHIDITATFVMSIQSAIDSAQDGDVIMVPPGTYFENLNLKGKNITLTSADPEDPEIVNATIINGGGKDAVIRVESGETGAVITGFTITNGIGRTFDGVRYGGGVYVRNSDITLSHSIIRGNNSRYGGGVYINSAMSFTMKYNTVSENAARDGGGMYFDGGNHTITGNIVSDNTTDIHGGGGGMYFDGGNHTIMGNIVSDNTTGNYGRGGGMYFDGGNHTIKGNTVSENSAPLGGGFYLSSGTHTIAGNEVKNNSAVDYWGGGFFISRGAHTIRGNTVSENSAQEGGALSLYEGTHTIEGNTVSENSSTNSGGGFNISGGTHTIRGNTLTNNSSTNSGGGIYLISSGVRLTMNLFQLNNASNNGGAVWVSASSTIVDDSGNALPSPDLFNDYVDNTPDDVFYE